MNCSMSVPLKHILMVEDNPGDVRLTREALREEGLHSTLSVVRDGVEALAYLRKEVPFEEAERPDLILLDLNLPRRNGKEVLQIVKADATLKRIPMIIWTTSKAEKDILDSYNLHANCFVTKPVDLDAFLNLIRMILQFWFTIVRLPSE